MYKSTPKYIEDITALGDGGVTPALLVVDWEDIGFDLVGAGTSVLTVQLLGSVSKDAPDFSAAVTATNRHFPVLAQLTDDDSAFDGTTGIAFTVDALKNFVASIKGITWIAFKVTAHTTGTVQPFVSCYDN